MPRNTHRAYIKCVHVETECDGGYHLAASGSEEHCNKVLAARVTEGNEGYVREATEKDF